MITLATLPQATAQQVFDQVAEHLLKQKLISVDDQGICQYRGPAGLKCAAGCLIGDDEYKEYFESFSWRELFNMGYVPENHLELIKELQRLHDGVSTNAWKDALKLTAENNKLEWKFENL